MTDEEKLKDYQRQLRNIKADRDQAQGALNQVFESIKAEFPGVKTMQEFERSIEKMKSERDTLKQKFDKKMLDLEKEYDWR